MEPALGEALHQYQRNLYLERLYRAGVRLEHHLELVGAAGGRAAFVNVFDPELETALRADALVLALGRFPVAHLAEQFASLGLPIEEAGDCVSPRSLEEAILEGTLAARRAADRARLGVVRLKGRPTVGRGSGRRRSDDEALVADAHRHQRQAALGDPALEQMRELAESQRVAARGAYPQRQVVSELERLSLEAPGRERLDEIGAIDGPRQVDLNRSRHRNSSAVVHGHSDFWILD